MHKHWINVYDMGNPNPTIFLWLFISFFFVLITHGDAASDSLRQNETISDGQTLLSSTNSFVLGFFTPPGVSPDLRYVGIWYNKPGPLVVIWVANRESPVIGTTGVLKLHSSGSDLVILDGKKKLLWSTGMQNPSNNSNARLEDSGNLVLRTGNGETIWQSFGERTNMLIPKSDVSVNLKKNTSKPMVSWKSDSDPSPGGFSLALHSTSFVQWITFNGSAPYWRAGPWIGPRFIGIPEMRSSYANGFSLNRDDDGISFRYAPSPDTALMRLMVESDGLLVSWIWDQDVKKWVNEWRKPEDPCDLYGTCGEFSVCDPSLPVMCTCMKGYMPKYGEEWSKGNWTGGCVRRKELACENMSRIGGESSDDGFFRLERLKLPDFAERIVLVDTNAAGLCADHCLKNCSCLAYAYVDNNCMVWVERLLDVRAFSLGGEDLYIKLAASELDQQENSKTKTLVVILAVPFGLLLCFLLCLLWRAVKRKDSKDETIPISVSSPTRGTMGNDAGTFASQISLEFTLFTFDTIVAATEDFSWRNKLGEGGFGSVYKGVLADGQEIAVKRLSVDAGQGLDEFKNEVMLISKLQHRNLVRLLGCCIDVEKLLVYEFMPNKSLDAFLFGPKEHRLQDWAKRFQIIEGVAQGLIYLHRDSRLKIIHRDLKASNILLDSQLNPKIADFGTARIFIGDQIQEKTRRVVGTYGYMSPEYAMHGQFSEKSDVFSFGVLLLEIISGKRISTFYNDEHSLNLVGYAWKLWNEGNTAEFVDPNLRESWPQSNASLCIHVALLCVQEVSSDRPPMSYLLSMLSSEPSDYHGPKMPAFIGRRVLVESHSSENDVQQHSANNITLTRIEGR